MGGGRNQVLKISQKSIKTGSAEDDMELGNLDDRGQGK